ncbi:TIGR01620 family protein [Motiliproteus sp. MSK22-1]|uniref:TIGR01620 family protein n=1 Tax=Motiliproteus sp. MSK22-1 TaxID=1897630 RepID=UPI000977801C|nr:TIGR01620 family protein [Motiliproteus sp. MSK22-1]OMH33913.1 TIGR01620 family protein [Motiliproteus sp. MSK22-1]
MSNQPDNWTKAREIDPDQLIDSRDDLEITETRNAQMLDPEAVIVLPETEEPPPVVETSDAPRRASFWGKLFAGSTAIVLGSAVIAECYRLSSWGYEQHWLLGSLLSAVMVTSVIAGGVWSLKSLRGLRQLKQREAIREMAEELQHSHGQGSAAGLLEKLCLQTRGTRLDAPLQQAITEIDSVYKDGEIVRFVSNHGFQEADQRAMERVSKHSLETAVMVGVSPFVTFDMLLIAWRNLKMMNEVADIYGVAPGSATQWRLIKQVLHNLAFVGLTELTIDGGGALLGSSLTTQLSARMGQGLGAGLMTGRVGIQAVRLCRPFPYDTNKQPRLGHIQKQIMARLKDRL